MKRFICWLTGGHIYHDADLMVRIDDFARKIIFKNHCLKCGKVFRIDMPKEIFDRAIKYELTRRELYSAIQKEGEQK